MKAVQYEAYGNPDVLHIAEIEEPHAADGEIRIVVKAAAVNPIDWKIRSGAMAGNQPLDTPAGIGMDASGIVDEVGADIEDVSIGDAVFGSTRTSATAEYAVLSEWVAKPGALPFDEAAGFVMASETAQRALNLLSARAGQTLVINGASGGVGLTASQFAVATGLDVIGTASERNHEFLQSIGVTPTTYGDGLVARVNALAPQGVDLALDVAGSGVISELIELTGSADNVITIADFSAAELGVRVTTGGSGESAPEGRKRAAELYESGEFTLPVAETFDLDAAAQAHAKSQEGHVLGKYVIVVK